MMNRRTLVQILFGSSVLGLRLDAAGAQQTAQAPPAQRVFGSDAGMVLNVIKPDKTADFEMVIDRLKAALHQSTDDVRKQQAGGWRVFKSTDPGANNTVIYVFWLNPVIKGADYTVSKILFEAFPTEAHDLYEKFAGSYSGGQTILNLQLVSNLGQPA